MFHKQKPTLILATVVILIMASCTAKPSEKPDTNGKDSIVSVEDTIPPAVEANSVKKDSTSQH
jgi:hypothetical protein